MYTPVEGEASDVKDGNISAWVSYSRDVVGGGLLCLTLRVGKRYWGLKGSGELAACIEYVAAKIMSRS